MNNIRIDSNSGIIQLPYLLIDYLKTKWHVGSLCVTENWTKWIPMQQVRPYIECKTEKKPSKWDIYPCLLTIAPNIWKSRMLWISIPCFFCAFNYFCCLSTYASEIYQPRNTEREKRRKWKVGTSISTKNSNKMMSNMPESVEVAWVIEFSFCWGNYRKYNSGIWAVLAQSSPRFLLHLFHKRGQFQINSIRRDFSLRIPSGSDAKIQHRVIAIK